MFPGFSERMETELNNLVSRSKIIEGIGPPKRNYSTWIASDPSFQEKWISKADYDEVGL